VPDSSNGSARTGKLERLSDERLAALAGGGDERAFELIYERHHRSLLSFCRHMLGNQEEGEDALQQTFMRALRALQSGQLPKHARGWLYSIARNCSLTLLSARRDVPSAELDELPSTSGLADDVQTRTDLRDMLADMARLPEEQRAALVLAELGDLSQDQIGEVLGVPRDRVKSLVYQARHTLIAERSARSASCVDIRAELSVAHGPELRRGRLKRHLRACDGCRAFHADVGHQRAAFAVLLPVIAGEALHGKVLGTALAAAKGATAAGGAAAGASTASIGTGTTVAGVATKATLAKCGMLAVIAGAATGGVVEVDHSAVSHAPKKPVAVVRASDHGSSIRAAVVKPAVDRPVAATVAPRSKLIRKAHRQAVARHRRRAHHLRHMLRRIERRHHRRHALRKLTRRQGAAATPVAGRHQARRLERIERHKAARDLRRQKRQARRRAQTQTQTPAALAPTAPRRHRGRRITDTT
jgi:RNA polymerase sigma factor (sigma-70 family)